MSFFIKTIQKFKNAITGILITLKEEKTIQLQLIYTLFIIVIGILLKINYDRWAILIICLTVNVVIEMINSALENFLDLITFNYNLRIKKIKDIFAGSSLIFSLSVITVSGLILIPVFITYVKQH